MYANRYIWNLKKKKNSEEPRARTEIKTQMWRVDMRMRCRRGVLGGGERVAWTYIHYHM